MNIIIITKYFISDFYVIVCVCSLASSTSDRLKAYLKAPGYPPCSAGKGLAIPYESSTNL